MDKEGLSKTEIAKRLGISRKTVAKNLKKETTPKYKRLNKESKLTDAHKKARLPPHNFPEKPRFLASTTFYTFLRCKKSKDFLIRNKFDDFVMKPSFFPIFSLSLLASMSIVFGPIGGVITSSIYFGFGAGIDLLMAKAKHYGATAIRNNSSNKSIIKKLGVILKNNKLQIIIGVSLFGCALMRSFSSSNILANIFILCFGGSLSLMPFIFEKKIDKKDKDSAILNNNNEINSGGITLNPKQLNLQTQGNNIDFSQLSNSEYIQSLKNTPGLKSVILDMQPMTENYLELFFGKI